MTVTLQIEVADRIKSLAGEEDYGVLSLLLQVRYAPENLFRIARGCFFPEPDVDSACITLVKRPQELLSGDLLKLYVQIVKQSLSQRRKMMRKLLKQIGGVDWDNLMTQAGIPLDIRGEKVSLEAFVKLTQLYAESRRNL